MCNDKQHNFQMVSPEKKARIASALKDKQKQEYILVLQSDYVSECTSCGAISSPLTKGNIHLSSNAIKALQAMGFSNNMLK